MKQNSILELDAIDIAILKELQQDSRLSVRELSARVHRSSTAVFERLKRLEHEGVIKSYTITIDHERMGRGFTVFCNVKLRQINTEIHSNFAAAIAQMPEVTECYNVSGAYDYLLKVEVPDMHGYRTFVTECLGNLPMLDSVQSIFAMQEILRRQREL